MCYDLSDHSNIPRSQKWKIITCKHGEFQENSVGQSKMHTDCHSNTHSNPVSVHSFILHFFIHIRCTLYYQVLGMIRCWVLREGPCPQRVHVFSGDDAHKGKALQHGEKAWCRDDQKVPWSWKKDPLMLPGRRSGFRGKEWHFNVGSFWGRCWSTRSGKSYQEPCNSLTQGSTQHRGCYAAVSVYFSNVF